MAQLREEVDMKTLTQDSKSIVVLFLILMVVLCHVDSFF